MFLVGAIAALGCGGNRSGGVEPSCCAPSASSDEELDEADDDSAALASDEVGPLSPDCSRLSRDDSVQEKFERGKYLVDSCDEMCQKSKDGGTKRQEGLSLLRDAATKGHLAAQAFYGRTKFTDLMTTGIEPALEDEYVEATYFLSLAARRGNTEAQSEIPQLETLAVKKDGSFTEPLTEPLSHLDEEWVKAAVKRAQADLPCYENK